MQCTAQTVLYSQAESVFASELSDYRSQHIKRLFGSAVYFSIKLLLSCYICRLTDSGDVCRYDSYLFGKHRCFLYDLTVKMKNVNSF